MQTKEPSSEFKYTLTASPNSAIDLLNWLFAVPLPRTTDWDFQTRLVKNGTNWMEYDFYFKREADFTAALLHS